MVSATGNLSISNSTVPSVSEDGLGPFITITIIIIIGLVGNSFVITIVAMINSMKTTTNYLLVNVAIADFLTLLFSAIHMILFRTVFFGNSFLCKIIAPNTVSNVALLATSFTLTVLAIERYNALVKPMLISRRLTQENVIYVIMVIWVISIAMNLPFLIHMDYDPVIQNCSPGAHHKVLLISNGGIVFAMMIIPFVIIALSYSQIISGLYFRNTIFSSNQAVNPGLSRDDLVAKRKLVKLLVTITIVFFIAFVPYGVLQILRYGLTAASQHMNITIIQNLSEVMVYLIPIHSSINPFLYALQSNNYRQGFKFLAKKLMCVKNQGWNAQVFNGSVQRTPPAISYMHDNLEMGQQSLQQNFTNQNGYPQ